MDKNKILLIIFCICFSLFLVLFSYKMVFTFTSYDIEQEKVIDFLEGGELEVDMTPEEVSHLWDVKGVMKGIDYVFYFLLLVCTLVITYGFRDKKFLRELFLYGGISGFGLTALFLIFSLIGFEFLFNLFHQVFFQGNWMFSTDSFLIQTFPLCFFISMFKKIIILALILASIFIGGGIYLKHAD